MRLSPAYYIAIAAYWITAIGLHYTFISDDCRKYVWANILYVSNLVIPYGEQCMSWSWSLGVEMQMYLFSPLIVMAMCRYEREQFEEKREKILNALPLDIHDEDHKVSLDWSFCLYSSTWCLRIWWE